MRGTREEIQEALGLIKEILGEERYKYVKQFDHNGPDGYAFVLNIDAKDVKAFSQIGDDRENKILSEGMAEILSSSRVAEVRMDGNFINLDGKLLDVRYADFTGSSTHAGGTTVGSSWSKNKNYQVVLSPNSVELGNAAARDPRNRNISKDGRPLDFTKAMILAHELGHVQDKWRNRYSETNQGALDFENAMRSRNPNDSRRRRAEN